MANKDDVRKLPVEFIVEKLGGVHQPGESGKGIRYTSPFRSEKKGSFYVYPQDNKWYDFGHSGRKGGDSIDLIQEYLKSIGQPGEFTNAMEFADSQLLNAGDIEIKRRTDFVPKSNPIIVGDVRDDLSPSLIDYLKERGIQSRGLIREHLKQVFFKFDKDDKTLFAIGFQNDGGDYELRNKFSKYASGKKEITNLKGKDSSAVVVFEGFFDFLSYMEQKGLTTPDKDVIVANSANLENKVVARINENKYSHAHVFADNNKAGQNFLKAIENDTTAIVIDKSINYKGYEDLNEFHRIQQKKTSPLAITR